MLEHVFGAVRVAESHVVKRDAARDRLPVLALRLKRGAVLFDDLRRVGDECRALHQRGDALDVRLRRDKIRDRAGELLHRVGDHERIIDENGHVADRNVAEKHHAAAARQNERDADRGQKADDRDVDGVQPYGVDRRAAHVVGHGAEGRVVLILDHERFRGLCAGNTLVVVAGYLGVDRAHAAVDGEDLLLENDREHRDDRDDCDQNQRELPVVGEHDEDAADHVRGAPEDVHEAPGEHGANLVGVAHDARHDAADRRRVVVGKIERLQMLEQTALQISAEIHLHLQGENRHEDRGKRHQDDKQNVEQDKGHDTLRGARLDEVVHRVAGKKRLNGVDARAEQHRGHDQNHVLFVRGEKRQEFRPRL